MTEGIYTRHSETARVGETADVEGSAPDDGRPLCAPPVWAKDSGHPHHPNIAVSIVNVAIVQPVLIKRRRMTGQQLKSFYVLFDTFLFFHVSFVDARIVLPCGFFFREHLSIRKVQFQVYLSFVHMYSEPQAKELSLPSHCQPFNKIH